MEEQLNTADFEHPTPDASSAEEASGSAGSPGIPVPALPPPRRSRSVNAAFIEQISKKVEELDVREANLASDLEAFHGQLSISRRVMTGLSTLRAVLEQEQFPLGPVLLRLITTSMMSRLKSRPRPATRGFKPRKRAQQKQRSMSFDVTFTRGGLDELVNLRSLAYNPRVERGLYALPES